MRRFIPILICFFSGLVLIAQPAQKFIREGNSLYQDGKFKEAEIDYRKALNKSPNSVKATYNLGNSQYKQQNFTEAANSYQKLAIDPKNAKQAQLFHNLGNAYLESKKYEESVDAYKKSLRINPKDEDTRYNLAYAMSKMQQQENKNKQDKNKQNQQNQQQKQQQKQQQQQQQQKQNEKMSKQSADRMLNALNNNEKRTLDKVKKQQAKPVGSQPEKDW
jgi:Ca-activated chloride channel family protein